MPHIPGHTQNSKKRIGKKFPKKAGVLFPCREENGKLVKLDYPIIFFNTRGIELKYGDPICFLPNIIELSTGEFFVYASDIWVRQPDKYCSAHEDESLKTGGISAEDAFKASRSYRRLYQQIPIDQDAKKREMVVAARNPQKDLNAIVDDIYKNAIPFDDMNLATN